ncbi:ADP/ATP-dependent (S)-NAD(P)H-hydrate dehydratase [uncultured Candidatus Puniceispirillum sp.]|uniref:ADP-dependent NAD(P)H-hydrate dehydratase n=1 Tax=uncultured Candidatus Puniceispirillum sp. TaxID=1985115 RepID=UPI0032B19631
MLDAEAIMVALSQGRFPQKTLITPHQGEFDRSFSEVSGSKKERAYKVAKSHNIIVILKGAQTVIASPDGRMSVNVHASPYLASAGTGDVLAGLVAGLIAQAMPPFEACCAAVWMHGDAAIHFGPGMIAGDIPDLIPFILGHLLELRNGNSTDRVDCQS